MDAHVRNRGQRLLDDLVEKHGTLRAVSALVPEIHENQLGNYHRGPRLPLIPARKALEEKLGIPFFAWDEAAEDVKGAA